MSITFSGGADSDMTINVTLDLAKSDQHNGAEMPIKLGDGNFGAVYAATGANKDLAVKFIYDHQVPTVTGSKTEAGISPTVQDAIDYKHARVAEELTVHESIFRALSRPDRQHPEYEFLRGTYFKHLVLPQSYTFSLHKQAGFKPFAKRFRNVNVHFSDYAYVMERFECSLKDLMDYGGRNADTQTSSGYSKLENVEMIERERSAIPVLLQVAAGLRVLHAADYRHQDIKPANVYFRRDGNRNVEFRLGDLGFLNPRPAALGGSVLASTEALAIGTKHYRSVEQIDFADTSEVSVHPAQDNLTATIISRDPKFAHTNISQGDLVVFPKSASKNQYKITEFKTVEDEKDATKNYARITIATPQDPRGSSVALYEELTQASFIKNPTARTDLFGLGGLLFDILTAGGSPERFYELIRKFDVAGRTIQDTILNYYDNWKAQQHVDPDVSAIFKRINSSNGNESVSMDTLAFLLKCCASNTDDSFFNKFGFANDFVEGEQTPWEQLGAELGRIGEAIEADTYVKAGTNALTREPIPGEPPHILNPTREDEPVRDVLGLFQQLAALDPSDPDTVCHRWLRGVAFLGQAKHYFDQVEDKLERRDLGSGSAGLAYISLAPQHTMFHSGNALYWKTGLAEVSWPDFLQKLRSLDSLVCSLELHQSFYQPIWWPSRMRRVAIELVDAPTVGKPAPATPDAKDTDAATDASDLNDSDEPTLPATSDHYTLRVQYSGFTQAWKDIAKGDYLIVINDRNNKCVFEVSGDSNTVVPCRLIENGPETPPFTDPFASKPHSGYAIKAFEPLDYMAGMYAIYIFHALFYTANTKGITEFGNRASARAIGFPVADTIIRPSAYVEKRNSFAFVAAEKVWGAPRSPFDRMAAHSCALSIWLMLGGYRSEPDAEKGWSLISKEIGLWMAAMHEYFGSAAEKIGPLHYQRNDPLKGTILDNLPSDIGWKAIDAKAWRDMVDEYLQR